MKNYWKPNVLRMADGADGGSGGAGGGAGGADGGDAGKGAADWRAGLPDDLKSHASLKDIKDIPSLAKSFVHAQQLVGAEKLPKPQKNWTEAQWNDFYKGVGRPETPDKYSYKPDMTKFEGIQIDDAKMATTKAQLHKLGLTDSQVSGALDYYLGTVASQAKEINDARTAQQTIAMTALRQEFGDDYDTKLSIAGGVVKKFGSPELHELVEKEGLGNNPAFIKLFASIGEAMMDDKAVGSGFGLVVTDAATALAEINQLKGDADFQKALGDRSNPGHKVALEKWEMLHGKAYPPKKS